MTHTDAALLDPCFREDVARRFGLIPNLFCSTCDSSGLTRELWAMAKSAYLDNPLPSLFKERLFVHLSRFTEIRYCIVRHAGYLLGQGHASGDATTPPSTVAEVIQLLRRPFPEPDVLDRTLARLEAAPAARDVPASGSEAEGQLFDALTIIFLAPMRSGRSRAAVRAFLGAQRLELLMAFLAFVRTAHFWTENHPGLEYEPDMVACMNENPELAALLLDTHEAKMLSPNARLQIIVGEGDPTEQALFESQAKLRRTDMWLAEQRDAFQAAMNGQPLDACLNILVQAVLTSTTDGRRCAFYIADRALTALTHVVGMPLAYAQAVDNFVISPESLSCGLAVATGKPVITHDVLSDERWTAWRWMAEKFDYRACWSFPVETAAGRLVGSFAFYFAEPHSPNAADYEMAAAITQAAAIIISRHQENEDRQCAEQAMQDWNKQLETRVADEVAAREKIQAGLIQAQRMEALGQLAGGIAHDFNNVIQAVEGGASIIEHRPRDTERVRSLARRIIEASERGAAITRRLLAFSRRGDLRAEAVDAIPLLAGMREILSHTLGAGITVQMETESELPLILVDKAQLETVLINLATNARDAMDDMGTLTFAASVHTVEEKQASTRPPALKAGSYMRLTVRDTGPGMTPDVLARASEPFFTTKAVGKGTGLGLAMARGFAEQSGGGMVIESVLGCGTSIQLWLPLALANASVEANEPNPPNESTAQSSKARVMLVDDDVVVRETLTIQLESEGFAVLSVESGAEAIALLDAGEKVNLLVSDLSMPIMDGVSLIREVQRRRPRLPAILLTGFATSASGIGTDEPTSGMLAVLRKPIRGRELAERIAILLEGAATSKARLHLVN